MHILENKDEAQLEPLTFMWLCDPNPLCSIDGFGEVCLTISTNGFLCALGSAPAQPAVVALSITPYSELTLPTSVPSQSLAAFERRT